MKNAEERMIQAQEMAEKVAADNEKLREIVEFLKEIPEHIEPLSTYYFDQWMNDISALEETDFHNEVMNQDLIFEEISEQYQLMKEIILIAANYINRDEF